MGKKHGYYRPEDPEPGDLVFLSDSWSLPMNNPEALEDKTGVITHRLGPDIHNGVHQYKIQVKLANGTEITSHSRDWKCLRTLERSTKSHLAKQQEIIHRLELWIEKAMEEKPPLKKPTPGPEPEL